MSWSPKIQIVGLENAISLQGDPMCLTHCLLLWKPLISTCRNLFYIFLINCVANQQFFDDVRSWRTGSARHQTNLCKCTWDLCCGWVGGDPRSKSLLYIKILRYFKIFKGLNPSDFFLRPTRAGLPGHTYRSLQGPSHLRRRSGAFSVCVTKYWNRLPTPSKNSWTVNNSKSFPQHLCKFCSPSSTFFSVLYPYLFFPYFQILVCLFGYCWPSLPILPLTN